MPSKTVIVTLLNESRHEITVDAKCCLTKRSRVKSLTYKIPVRGTADMPVTHFRKLSAKGKPLHLWLRSGDVRRVDSD